MERLLCIAIGYACGLLQTGYLYGKMMHIDIRTKGSGNAGATNVLRTLGWRAGLVTFLGDCFKCIFAVMLAKYIFEGNDHVSLFAMYAALGAVLGHNFPFYLQFKGGKGIATTAGMIIATMPMLALILIVIFVIVVLLTKYVSLGSIIVAILFFVGTVFYGQSGFFGLQGVALYELYAVAGVLTVLAIVRHRANIKRLLTGTENKISFHKK